MHGRHDARMLAIGCIPNYYSCCHLHISDSANVCSQTIVLLHATEAQKLFEKIQDDNNQSGCNKGAASNQIRCRRC